MSSHLSPRSLSLPFPTWRPGQLDQLLQMATSDKKYLLLEAPTGSGKSALSVSLGRLHEYERVIFLTGTKALQTQYMQAFEPSGMAEAKGRSNFPCHITPGSAAEAPCTYGSSCSRINTPLCDYYAQKIKAANSSEAVLNYQYWLAMTNYGRAFRDADLLVCDEAHTIEDELRKFVTIKLKSNTAYMLKIQLPTFLDAGAYVDWAVEVTTDARQATMRMPHDSPSRRRAEAFVDALRQIALKVDDEWVVESNRFGLEFKPVWVNKVSQDCLLRHAQRIVFMSATILDQEMFCTNLGLPVEDVDMMRVASTFPKARRPLYYQPVGKVKASDEAVLGRLSAKVEQLLQRHSGRGLIHTANYKIARYLVEHDTSNRLFTHTTETRASAILHLKGTPGAVLVSPSATTGLDLPYELCEWQAIAKIPFPDMGDPQTKKRMRVGPDGKPLKRGQNWYNWQTLAQLCQAYGRGMRAEDDACITYLLDGNFGWFRPAVSHMIPEWVQEAIVWPSKSGTGTKSTAEQIREAITASRS